MIRLQYISLVLIFCSCYVGEEVAPDQEVWKYARPKEVGLSEEALLTINSRIQTNDFSEIDGLIIIKNDQLIFENYFDQDDSQGFIQRLPTLSKRHSAFNLNSASLTFALAAIGVAEDKRLIDIEDRISDYLPEYEDVFLADSEKENITIEHLLLHKSGLSWNVIQQFSPQNDLNQMKASEDWVRYILEQPMEAPAGIRFNLNTASGVLLAKIVENASDQSFNDFIKENVIDPLTITSFDIETDPSGNFNAGDGIRISLLDWTKLGYLFLQEGLWRGRKILDPNFIENATSVQTEVSGTQTLGYIWWQFGDSFSNAFAIPSNEIIFIPGELGQHMYLIPSENMIVSIFADNLSDNFYGYSQNLFTEIINSFQ
ncbi:serine hydrolase [Ekhidna sp. MALMAid0563]|uniref:serine hydrolase domain-containing protein n=1 Tax=Ekhidna sp. MALMAid0563 TaxID=3143937 RepID=UPI0032DEC2AB